MDQNLLNYYYIRVVANIFFSLLHLMNDCCQLPETATGTIRSILPIYVQKQFIAQGSSNAQVSILYLILLSFHYCLSGPSFWVDCWLVLGVSVQFEGAFSPTSLGAIDGVAPWCCRPSDSIAASDENLCSVTWATMLQWQAHLKIV